MLTLVGGAGGCSLRLVSRTVARFHCALLLTPAGLWAVDLRGTDGNPEWQGITINGSRAAWGHLADNDEILVGRFLYRVRYDQVHAEGLPNPSETRSLAVWDQPYTEGELVPSGTGLRGVPGGAGRVSEQVLFAQALLGPILNQFGLMQRQMLTELEQTLSTVVDRVEALHREQTRRMEAEASRLDQRLRALQTEVAKIQGATQASQRPTPAPPRVAARDTADSTLPSPSRTAAAPALKSPRIAGGATAVDLAGPGQAPTPGEPPGPDVDTWLYDRLQEFHQEQQNLWRRVLHRVLGK
jgi:hypothetical protein